MKWLQKGSNLAGEYFLTLDESVLTASENACLASHLLLQPRVCAKSRDGREFR